MAVTRARITVSVKRIAIIRVRATWYCRGPTDGVFGPETRNAIRSYQAHLTFRILSRFFRKYKALLSTPTSRTPAPSEPGGPDLLVLTVAPKMVKILRPFRRAFKVRFRDRQRRPRLWLPLRRPSINPIASVQAVPVQPAIPVQTREDRHPSGLKYLR